jgi:hypothetical protein
MFPVILNDQQLPDSGTYYVVAANGIFLHKDNGLFRGLVKVDGVSYLEEITKPTIKSNLPLLPSSLTTKIKKFFQVIVAKYDAESCTVLYFNKDTRDFKVVVPEQRVSKGSVQYRREGEINGYLPVGTIHSHCDFSAFHSGTDISDEDSFDGLHCTFGHNDKLEFSITASLVMNGFRVQIDPLTVLDGIEKVGEFYKLASESTEDITDWVNQVKPYREGAATLCDSLFKLRLLG